ncbi:MAG: PASTA domain-containing protein [Acutalibacteraceae bacterium]|nr:PASTA domain-containing protein [Acutalibacteraceae bacterium]
MLTFDKLCMGCMNDNGGEDVCPICGYVADTPNPESTLPVKTRIHGRYIVGKATEINGEGITYIGWDNDTSTIVNIREFFPVPLAVRKDDLSVGMSDGNEYFYNAALLDFIELGKKLSSLSIPAVPEVCEVIECNSTAYIITKSVAGITLREFLLRNGSTLSWEQTRPLFMPFLSSLIALHKEGIIHGGISPETVIVGRDGKLRLSGFSIPQLRKSDSPINSQIFPGFAAIEQYEASEQGITEATDVYGFAATLFRVLMGSTLPEANERITDDKMSIPSKIATLLPQDVLVSLANALQILFENRTKTMEEFKIDISPAIDTTAGFVAADTSIKENGAKTTVKSKEQKPKKDTSARKYAIIAASITAGIFLVIALIFWIIIGKPFAKEPDPSPVISSSVPSDVESSSVPSGTGEKLLTVPDFAALNLSFEEICNEYPDFRYVVLGKKYSSKGAGIVVSQDIKAGSQVKRDTTIYLTVSLGPETLTIPDLKGKTREEAILELYKKGFLYHNIYEVPIEDSTVDYDCIVKTDPAIGSTINPETTLKIYYSNVKGDTSDTSSTNTSSGNQGR